MNGTTSLLQRLYDDDRSLHGYILKLSALRHIHILTRRRVGCDIVERVGGMLLAVAAPIGTQSCYASSEWVTWCLGEIARRRKGVWGGGRGVLPSPFHAARNTNLPNFRGVVLLPQSTITTRRRFLRYPRDVYGPKIITYPWFGGLAEENGRPQGDRFLLLGRMGSMIKWGSAKILQRVPPLVDWLTLEAQQKRAG